jgi:cell division protein FtsB
LAKQPGNTKGRDALRRKRTGFGKLKIIVLLGVLIYVGVTFANQQSIMATQLERRDKLAQQEAALQREIDFRRNELNYIGTDDYIEQQARIRLGWLLPGEIKYVEDTNGNIIPATPSAEPTTEENADPGDDAD